MVAYSALEIKNIINRILSASSNVVKALRAEKKQTGSYRETTEVVDSSYVFLFSVENYNLNPSIGKYLSFAVKAMKDGYEILTCKVYKNNGNGFWHDYVCCENDKFVIEDVCLSDRSNVVDALKVGDIITVSNSNSDVPKVAYAKVDKLEFVNKGECKYLKSINLVKVIGHKEVMAYKKGYPSQICTYIVDDSTEEFFEGKDSKKIICNIEIIKRKEPVKYEGYTWYYYTKEELEYSRYGAFALAKPITEKELTAILEKEALEQLLEDCRGEFCYLDPRVYNNQEYYSILGKNVVEAIYNKYMEWLSSNCTTFPQDSTSGEFTGVAIDWHGKENKQPIFDLSDKESILKSNNVCYTPKEDWMKEYIGSTINRLPGSDGWKCPVTIIEIGDETVYVDKLINPEGKEKCWKCKLLYHADSKYGKLGYSRKSEKVCMKGPDETLFVVMGEGGYCFPKVTDKKDK